MNFAFAANENMTDLSIDDSQDAEPQDVLSVEDNVEEVSEIATDEELSAVDDGQSEIIKQVSNSTTPTVKKGKVTNRYYNGVIYTATFYDASGNPLKNTQVGCGVNSKDYGSKATTDSNGVAKFKLPLSKGTYKLYLINPLTNYTITDTIKVFDVISGNKDITMYYDGGNVYKVRVYDDNGKPVKAGKKVTFKINGKKYTKKTDKNGYAKLKIANKPGLYYILANYKDFDVSNTVTVKQVLKQLTSFSGKRLTSTFKYKVKFLGKNKKNKKIKVKFNKKTYKAKTNKKGIATFTLKTPKKSGSYTVTAFYKKTKVYSTFSRYVA
jgi:hypothetical protein